MVIHYEKNESVPTIDKLAKITSFYSLNKSDEIALYKLSYEARLNEELRAIKNRLNELGEDNVVSGSEFMDIVNGLQKLPPEQRTHVIATIRMFLGVSR